MELPSITDLESGNASSSADTKSFTSIKPMVPVDITQHHSKATDLADTPMHTSSHVPETSGTSDNASYIPAPSDIDSDNASYITAPCDTESDNDSYITDSDPDTLDMSDAIIVIKGLAELEPLNYSLILNLEDFSLDYDGDGDYNPFTMALVYLRGHVEHTRDYIRSALLKSIEPLEKMQAHATNSDNPLHDSDQCSAYPNPLYQPDN